MASMRDRMARAMAAQAMMGQGGGAPTEEMPPEMAPEEAGAAPEGIPPEMAAPGGDIESALVGVDQAAESLPPEQATKVRELVEQIRVIVSGNEDVVEEAPQEELPQAAPEMSE